MVYQNMLIAVDGSNEAEGAFQRALKIAKSENVKLYIAHVVDTKNLMTVQQYAPYGDFVEEARKYGENLLNEYAEKAKMQEFENVETVLQSGSPKRELSRNIPEKYSIDLIVCGATGLNAVERFVMGSVAEQIVRNAPCDVLVVRDEKAKREENE
ncbi:universal stress protein UspA [Pueribacillus theae]|uniref:Universal stress protein n=1 Tax=Pueribacillus theae TaxID=2171751 RepID=A0A2U1JI60_9BACI|nr:universal stress protein [Pueribacillus theae]PWA04822.1 universal stress protein UspA [Pueribacillus theae]